MQKIVINKCWGGFGLSEEAKKAIAEFKGHPVAEYDIARDDPVLVACVEAMGEAANGRCAELVVVEIPDGVNWEIDDYDGMETVEEVHRSWG